MFENCLSLPGLCFQADYDYSEADGSGRISVDVNILLCAKQKGLFGFFVLIFNALDEYWASRWDSWTGSECG